MSADQQKQEQEKVFHAVDFEEKIVKKNYKWPKVIKFYSSTFRLDFETMILKQVNDSTLWEEKPVELVSMEFGRTKSWTCLHCRVCISSTES